MLICRGFLSVSEVRFCCGIRWQMECPLWNRSALPSAAGGRAACHCARALAGSARQACSPHGGWARRNTLGWACCVGMGHEGLALDQAQCQALCHCKWLLTCGCKRQFWKWFVPEQYWTGGCLNWSEGHCPCGAWLLYFSSHHMKKTLVLESYHDCKIVFKAPGWQGFSHKQVKLYCSLDRNVGQGMGFARCLETPAADQAPGSLCCCALCITTL